MSEVGKIAITIDQPWASLIAVGLKDIENRDWFPPKEIIGTRLIIHAGRKYDYIGAFMLMNDFGIVCYSHNFPRGAIVGSAVLQEVVEDCSSEWFRGPYGWRFAEVQMLDPVPCTGQRRLWTVPEAVWDRVLLNSCTPLNPASFLECQERGSKNLNLV